MKNINNESLGDGLLDAIGDIGDDIVAEAASFKVKTPMLYRKLWITAAVFICTLALFGGALHMGKNRITPPPDISGISEITSDINSGTAPEEIGSSAPTATETVNIGTEIVSGVLTEDEPTSAAVTEDEPTEATTEPEPTTAAVTEPEPTTAAVTEPEPTTAAVTEPEPTTAAVTDPPSIPSNPQDTIAGIIDPPSTTPSARPPETTVVPTEPITPPEARPEDYKTVKGPEGGISEAYLLGKYFSTSSEMAAPPMPYFELNNYNFGVKATVVKSLPDVYYVYNEYSSSPTEYRVILMRAEDVLYGKEVPEYFYYAIESGLYADMSVYDFLFISMRQLGTDGYVMTNSSDMRNESFPLPVFNSYLPEFGRVIPFTNGIFDESLWQTPSWIFGYQFIETDLNDQTYHDVKRGCTAEYTLERIKPDNRTNEPTVVTLGDLKSIDADSVSYVTDFANGTFMQYFNVYNKTATFQRFIYGCKTDEVLKLDTNKSTAAWSGTRYSPEDIAALSNLSNYIKELEAKYLASTPVSPHVSPDAATLRQLRISGHYFEHNGKIYEVVKTHWYYMDRNYETDLETTYIDEVFVILENGTPRDISREELLALEPPFSVYIGDYSAIVDYIIHG